MPEFLQSPNALALVIFVGAIVVLIVGAIMLGAFGRGFGLPRGTARRLLPLIMIEVIVLALTYIARNAMIGANWGILQNFTLDEATLLVFVFLTALNIAIVTS